MKPNEIYSTFISRINKTNMLFENLTSDSSVEIMNTVYFKYYFDISATIEAIIRGITFAESKKHKYIGHIAQPESDKIGYFKDYEEIKALCGINKLFDSLNKTTFQRDFCEKIAPLQKFKTTKTFINDGLFCDDYCRVRKTRNILAHGLAATNTIEFNPTMLESFLYVLFVLYSFYLRSENENC